MNGASHGVAKNKYDLESGIRLCNGEIFFITEVSDNRKVVPFYLLGVDLCLFNCPRVDSKSSHIRVDMLLPKFFVKDFCVHV